MERARTQPRRNLSVLVVDENPQQVSELLALHGYQPVNAQPSTAEALVDQKSYGAILINEKCVGSETLASLGRTIFNAIYTRPYTRPVICLYDPRIDRGLLRQALNIGADKLEYFTAGRQAVEDPASLVKEMRLRSQ